MLFHVLGPLEVSGSRKPVSLSAGRQQVVLAVLLLEANRLVPVHRLVDAVWSDAPPSTARGQIHTCVSGLRRRFETAGLGGRIGTRRPGYLLRVSDDELDLHRFDRLVAEGRTAAAAGRPAEAAQRFRSALGLWRGDAPLSGIESDLLRAAVTSLTERRLSVIEECHTVELAQGRHHELVDQLLPLAERHPLREQLHHQLMLALHRCRRPGDALAAYRAIRRRFVAELGIEPSGALRDLHDSILRNDTALDPPPAPRATAVPAAAAPMVPRMLPAGNPYLTGRDDVVTTVAGLLRGSGTGGVATAVLAGRAGVGKTALAVHIAHRVAPGFPDGQLYARLDDEHGEPVRPEAVLERLLRVLGVPAAAGSRDELAARLRSALAGRRILVVLDGAVDEAQVLSLLPGSATCGVLVTSRHRLTGLSGAKVVELAELTIQHATELLIHLLGIARVSAEPAATFDLIELCGGLPLALRIAGERLAARPHWSIAELTERLGDGQRHLDELSHGPLDVRPGIATACARVGPSAQRLFRLLTLVDGEHFPTWVAGPLLGDPGRAAGDDLEALVDAQLVAVDRRSGPGTHYRIPKLLRSYARELLVRKETPATRAAASSRLLGAWLHLAEQAHSRAVGHSVPVLHGDAERWPLPVPLADQLLRHPLEWFETERAGVVRAVGQAADLGSAELCWDLAVTLAGLMRARDHLEDWRETHTTALTACRQAGDRRGEAVILYSLGTLDMVEQRYDEASGRLALALRAFEEIGDDKGRTLCLRGVAFLSRVGSEPLLGGRATR
ncbi:AfsR/SARP family transcriptional regulator [Amycolatopsis sp. NBC_01286]|uniref:AfsR/SARP family transcriptional regulator n=1 Tax=Amycolatopsis sp. NBC_01286 TaxID=2903560 RepID=UPI002E1013A7|nr:NB-ARC domain-containing protein [Amycolatopsis sp. NBC_01286]